jgi:hypothetical protein
MEQKIKAGIFDTGFYFDMAFFNCGIQPFLFQEWRGKGLSHHYR